MNKKIKWILLIVFTTYIGVLIMDKFDKRPIRFEDFKTSEELESFLYKKYPIGSDASIPFKDLELSGAKCELTSKKDNIPNSLKKYEYQVWCEYETGLISLHFLESYRVILLGNKNKKIINILAERTKGIII